METPINPEEMAMFLILGVLALSGLWILFKRMQWKSGERQKVLEIQYEVIRKFSSGAEFITFLRTDEGRRLFEGVTSGDSPVWPVVRALTASVMLALAGLAMFVNGYAWQHENAMADLGRVHDYYYWGSLSVAAAIGLLVNAWLMNRWGRPKKQAKDSE